MEPITFSGMFDSATGYLFTLSVPLLQSELDREVISISADLSGLTTEQTIQTELHFALSDILQNTNKECDYFYLTKQLMKLSPKKKILFNLYLGQDGITDIGLFQFLNRLRNLMGWNFSYNIYISSRLLFDKSFQIPLVDKVIKRNNVPVLPLDEKNSLVVLQNYEERYKKALSKKMRDKICLLSGGNPGIIKAIYLQGVTDDHIRVPDVSEEMLNLRLREILLDLPDEYKTELFSGKKYGYLANKFEDLVRYGYLVKHQSVFIPFTDLLSEYVEKYEKKKNEKNIKQSVSVDKSMIFLSISQRKVLEYFETHPGELISKDRIAEILWGESWADKYSDWAIDQLISTLRDKFSAIHQKGKLITKRGEGLIFVP